MRKIFIMFSALSLPLIMVLPIIACNNQFNDPNIYRITVITDGHTINDASFNESSYHAAFKFKQEFNDWTHSSYVDDAPQYKNKNVEVSWDNPQATNIDSLMTSYSKAVFINSKVIIASGFLHHDALVKSQNTILKHKVKFIFVDGDTPNTEVPKANKQLAGLLYKTEQSGFLAGLAGAIWLTAHANEYGGLNDLKMSTYGGLDIPAVVNYMYGYYWAIQFFNDKTSTNPIQDKLLTWVKILNPNFNGSLPTIQFVKLGTQFSGNFTQGSESSKGINDALVQQGSDIIFPVAGPQTEDTLSSLKKYGQGKIIGVDTDQQLQYPQSAARFITSAKKDLVNSINVMLWKAVGRTDDSPQHPIDANAASVFTDDAQYQGGSKFTGIAANEAIKDIYPDLVALGDASNTYHLLDKVSTGWQKVLALSKDYWINGIKNENNPFK